MGVKRYIQLFLNRGAPVNTNVGKYDIPLAAAAKRAEIAVISILLDAGAGVNRVESTEPRCRPPALLGLFNWFCVSVSENMPRLPSGHSR
jgi:hypothetical protein